MPDINQVKMFVKSPGTLKVGTTSATEIAEIIHGTVAFTAAGSIAISGVSAITAAVAGMTPSFNVILFPNTLLANEGHQLVAAVGIAGGIQVTARNMSGAATGGLNNQSAAFFAWR